jgi:hypothetical protein
MAQLTSQQANDLANNFLVLAQSVGDFRINNRSSLTVEDNQKLANWQWSIMNYGEDILAFSTTLVMNDVQTSLTQINDVASKIKGTIQTLQNIQKGINVAAAIVTLGAAIISKNPLTIADAISSVSDAWSA